MGLGFRASAFGVLVWFTSPALRMHGGFLPPPPLPKPTSAEPGQVHRPVDMLLALLAYILGKAITITAMTTLQYLQHYLHYHPCHQPFRSSWTLSL